MFKSFLILMLTTTQLLAGSGGTVCLCIKDDGSFCCLDTGSEACRRCEDDKPVVEEQPSSCCCCHESESQELQLEVQGSLPFSELALTSADPCGCTHILLAQDEANAKLSRVSAGVGLQQRIQMAANLPGPVLKDGCNAVSIAVVWQYRPPTVDSQALTVLSSTQIRC